jgi:Fe-S cluster assembly protein SufD
LVFVDGHYAPELSRVDELPEGVIIEPLARALPHHVDVIESHLAHYADLDANPFVALNTMLMSDGAFIHLPSRAVIRVPIHLLYFGTMNEGTAQLRNLIIAGEGSEATVIEHYTSADSLAYWTNAVSEIAVSENAGMEHYKLEEEGDKAFHIATLQIRQDRDSRFSSHNASLGGRLARNDINTRLEGENAQCMLNGLYVIKGRQHVDNHTRIDHVRPRTTSRELYKGVMDGWSRGVFNGKIIVHKNAQLTDSNQANHNLLLSPNAEADPKPQLEIFADDVKCTHGATVGQIDQGALYYLRSRGIPVAEARALLTFAFANDVITHMRLEPIRARLEIMIRKRLPEGEVITR